MTSRITVNGRTYTGSSVEVRNGKVYVDGKPADAGDLSGVRVLDVKVEGVLQELRADGNVEAQEIRGFVHAGGSVTCENVGGNVDAGGSVTCGDVGGDANAGGSVKCGKVSGKVSAGGSVRHG